MNSSCADDLEAWMRGWEGAIPAHGWMEATLATQTIKGDSFEPLSEEDLLRQTLGPLERVVETQPDAIAIDDGVRRLTFAQFWRIVQSLAAAIEAVTERDAMVLALTKSDIFFPVMVVGVQLAGRPLVVQDAASPIERQKVIFQAIAPAVGLVLVAKGEAVDIDYVSTSVPRIEVDLEPSSPTVPVRRPVAHDRLDGLIFTSGSTGQPKAIAVTARLPPKYIVDSINRYRVGPGDVVIALGSPSNVGIGSALTSLVSGARLVVVDMKQGGIVELFRVLREEKITILNLVPSVLRNLMQLPGADRAFASLRVLELAGEPMSWSDVALFRSKLSAGCVISFLMGSMEAGHIFQWTVGEDPGAGPQVPLGFLLAGRRIAVIGEDGTAASAGEAGELVISDDYVALGDWIDGRVDRERFPTDPATGKRVFATGDVVRLRSDGMFEFAGRRDRMVKVHGLRANLNEIEAILTAIPGVADAVVIAHERDSDHARLVAFVVPRPGTQIDNAEVRRRVASEAAPHMAPTAIHRLEEIPRLYNGKPDLVRLKNIAETAAGEGQS